MRSQNDYPGCQNAQKNMNSSSVPLEEHFRQADNLI